MHNTHRLSYMRGSSMIETLVSLLLLSFGALGVAGLQATSKQTSHEAQQRLLASYLTQDVIERMRNNSAALATYAGSALGGGSIGSEPTPNCSSSTPCNAAQLATHDRWVWEQSIDGAAARIGSIKTAGLVAPQGCINHSNGRVQVVIAWNDVDRVADAGAASGGVSTCGSASAYRRQVVISTFIS